VISAVDSHTEGMPTRVVTGGVGVLPGTTMAERRQWFLDHSDDLRTLLMYEPRRHGSMSGSILQPPTRADADYGVLFIEVSGLLPMCATAPWAPRPCWWRPGWCRWWNRSPRSGWIPTMGLVVAAVAVEDGSARSVTLTMVPSFCLALDQVVEVAGRGPVGYEMTYGGNF
jgi:proline racemase